MKKSTQLNKLFLAWLIMWSPAMVQLHAAEPNANDDSPLLEAGELLIEEESPEGEGLIIEGDQTGGNNQLLIEEGQDSDGDQLLIEDGDKPIILDTPERVSIQGDSEAIVDDSDFQFGVEELWVESGFFPDSNAKADSQSYLHSKLTARWLPGPEWEAQGSIRVDGYSQNGRRDWDHASIDLGETFIRYRRDDYRITLGNQTILWGRLDEFPPTDRMSTHDLSRFILDDLSDRRRASPALRYEYFMGRNKLDLVYLPRFREAELPGIDSVWFPVNQQSGQILGFESDPVTAALIQSTPVDTEAQDTDGGFGVRYSASGSGMDYALTLQKTRQTVPYFHYNPGRGVIETRYPRSWLLGGDVGVEALGAIWRLEGAWMSDAPITRLDGSYTTTKSFTWGAGVEFFPGDGDSRVNLQLLGANHIDSPAVLDRTEVYLVSGSVEVPFAQNSWRLKGRFYKGLDTHDLYLNPEIAFTGIDAHEIYLDAHYFEGAANTPGGFHEDNTTITLGWRAKF